MVRGHREEQHRHERTSERPTITMPVIHPEKRNDREEEIDQREKEALDQVATFARIGSARKRLDYLLTQKRVLARLERELGEVTSDEDRDRIEMDVETAKWVMDKIRNHAISDIAYDVKGLRTMDYDDAVSAVWSAYPADQRDDVVSLYDVARRSAEPGKADFSGIPPEPSSEGVRETLIPAEDREVPPKKEVEESEDVESLDDLLKSYHLSDVHERQEIVHLVGTDSRYESVSSAFDAGIEKIHDEEQEILAELAQNNPPLARRMAERIYGEQEATKVLKAFQMSPEDVAKTEVMQAVQLQPAPAKPSKETTELIEVTEEGEVDPDDDLTELSQFESLDENTADLIEPTAAVPVEDHEETDEEEFARIVGEFKLAKEDEGARAAMYAKTTDVKLQEAFENIEKMEEREAAEEERRKLREVGRKVIEEELQLKEAQRSGLVGMAEVDRDVAKVMYAKKGIEGLKNYLRSEEITDAKTVDLIVRSIEDDVLDYSGTTPVVKADAIRVKSPDSVPPPEPPMPTAEVVVDDDVLVKVPRAEVKPDASQEAVPDVWLAPKDVKFDPREISPVDELTVPKHLGGAAAAERPKDAVEAQREKDYVERMSAYADRFLRLHFKGELVEEESEKGAMTVTDRVRALGYGAASAAASTLGVKAFADVPRYLAQRHYAGLERARIASAFAVEGGGEREWSAADSRVSKMRQAVESSKYLSSAKKTELMMKLEVIMDEHRYFIDRTESRRKEQATKLIEAYVETRVTATTVAKELVNTAAVGMYLSGFWPAAAMGRRLAYGGLSLAERWKRVSGEMMKGERSGSFTREFFVNGFSETYRDLKGGDAQTRLGKVMKSASAIGTLGRILGIGVTGVGVAESASAATKEQIDALLQSLPTSSLHAAESVPYERVAGEASEAVEEVVVEPARTFEPEKLYGYGRPEGVINTTTVETGVHKPATDGPLVADVARAQSGGMDAANATDRGYVYPPREAGAGSADTLAAEVVETASAFEPVGAFEHEGQTIQFEYGPDGSPRGYDRANVMLELDAREIEAVSHVFESASPIKRGIIKVFAADLHVLRAMEEVGHADTAEYILIRDKMVGALTAFEEQGVVQVDEQNSLVAKYFLAEGVGITGPEAIVDPEAASTMPDAPPTPETIERVAGMERGTMETIPVYPYGAAAFVRDANGKITDLYTNMKLNPWRAAEAKNIVSVDFDMRANEIPAGWAQARREYGLELFKIQQVAEMLESKEYEQAHPGFNFRDSQERAFLKSEIGRIREEIERNWNGRLELERTNPSFVKLLAI